MKSLFSLFKKNRQSKANGYEPVKALFSKFRMILELNTQFLEKIAEMETALGGEFIFDRAYLHSSLREIGKLVSQVIYSLNALTVNRYVQLFDRFQTISATLENIVEGGFGPFGNKLTVPHSLIRWEMGPLIGQEHACLGEIAHRLQHRIPDGFVVTVTACRRFMAENDLENRIKHLRIDTATGKPNPLEIQTLIRDATVSEETELALGKELAELFQRRGVETPLSVSSCFPGLAIVESTRYALKRDFDGTGKKPGEHYKEMLADSFLSYFQQQPDVDSGKLPAVAVAFQEKPEPRLQGTLRTFVPEDRMAGEIAVRLNDGGNETTAAKHSHEVYRVRKSYPFMLLESKIEAKPLKAPLPEGGNALDRTKNNLLRGSSLVSKDSLTALLEIGVEIERIFGSPQQIDWMETQSGQRIILAATPITDEPADALSVNKLTAELKNAVLLLEGGETAQVGTAAGRIVPVTDSFRPEDFPVGSIAVARNASPLLSPILRKAGAMITEIGSPAGHLATVAREFRIPTIVGAKAAVAKLREGMEVTIDTEECKVYQGLIPSLLTFKSFPLGLMSADPEYGILRHLLRWIVPLNVIDPESPHFSPEHCQSLHDIIHFAHEKAVDEIVNLHSRHRQFKSLPTRSLETTIPLNIAILDMWDGILPKAGPRVRESEIVSAPFKALLRGLVSKAAWEQEPAAISLRDIVTGMGRTQDLLNSRPEFAGQNLAIVSREYLNLSLRLGYHFNVVDSYLSSSINENYIYFRFVGGFADPNRRHNRALLIRSVLEHLDFKVTIKGDLVVGKLKMVEFGEMEAVLVHIGELIAFTRQLDIKLVSETEVQRFLTKFTDRLKWNP